MALRRAPQPLSRAALAPEIKAMQHRSKLANNPGQNLISELNDLREHFLTIYDPRFGPAVTTTNKHISITPGKRQLHKKIGDYAAQENQTTDPDHDPEMDAAHAEVEADILRNLCQDQTGLYMALLSMDTDLTTYEKNPLIVLSKPTIHDFAAGKEPLSLFEEPIPVVDKIESSTPATRSTVYQKAAQL